LWPQQKIAFSFSIIDLIEICDFAEAGEVSSSEQDRSEICDHGCFEIEIEAERGGLESVPRVLLVE
jgi:hypothetical protein